MAMARASKKGKRPAKRGADIPRHKVFISFHVADVEFKDQFLKIIEGHAVDKSVHDDDIDDTNLKVARIRQIIRDEFIADATVTVVLVGANTWQRKHVDWEIGSSIKKTKHNDRCGLIGILLPSHPNNRAKSTKSNLLPPRLADNMRGDDPYAKLYRWPENPSAVEISEWIYEANLRRKGDPPDNGRIHYADNRSGNWSTGWQRGKGYPESFLLD